MFHKNVIFNILIICVCIAGIVHAKENVEFANEAFKRGDYNKAIEFYKLAIQNESSYSEYVNLGHCYLQLGQWDEAINAYEAAIKLNPDAIKASLWQSLGRAYFEAKKYEKAKDAFSKVLSLEPVNNDIEIWIVRCSIELEQWIYAQSVLLGQLSREPNNTIVLELLAYVYKQQKNYSGIISIYRELIKISPQNASYRITLAKMLMNQGQNNEAIDILEFVRRLDSKYDIEISRLLGDLYLSENMFREASQYYKSIIRQKDEPSAEDYYRLGLAYFNIHDLVSSLDIFELMKQKYPDDFRSYQSLGRIFSETERINDAMDCYSSALKKNPESLNCFEALSYLQMKNKLYSDAAINLAEAIKQGDNGSQIYYNYIFALFKANNPSMVKDAIKNALAKYPSDEKIRLLLNQFITNNFTD